MGQINAVQAFTQDVKRKLGTFLRELQNYNRFEAPFFMINLHFGKVRTKSKRTYRGVILVFKIPQKFLRCS